MDSIYSIAAVITSVFSLVAFHRVRRRNASVEGITKGLATCVDRLSALADSKRDEARKADHKAQVIALRASTARIEARHATEVHDKIAGLIE